MEHMFILPACLASATLCHAHACLHACPHVCLATHRLMPHLPAPPACRPFQAKGKDADYYGLLGLQHERWMATDNAIKQGV